MMWPLSLEKILKMKNLTFHSSYEFEGYLLCLININLCVRESKAKCSVTYSQLTFRLPQAGYKKNTVMVKDVSSGLSELALAARFNQGAR